MTTGIAPFHPDRTSPPRPTNQPTFHPDHTPPLPLWPTTQPTHYVHPHRPTGEGFFQGLPISLNGVQKVLDFMDWQDGEVRACVPCVQFRLSHSK